MKYLEEILKPTQEELFKLLAKKFTGKAMGIENSFILVNGEIPIMLVAHLDTVHKEPVKQICATEDYNIIMSPQGIGGDDRCGVTALLKAYELAVKKPYLLFTCDEEVGGIGAEAFCLEYVSGKLPDELEELKLIIEIDRKGKRDAVYYDCDNAEFEKYITSKGFKTAYGSFSDISIIAPELGVAAVNLSSGYYNPHQLCEYINLKHLNRTISKVVEIIAEVDTLPKFEYVESVRSKRHTRHTFRNIFADTDFDDYYGYDDEYIIPDDWNEK